MSYRSKVLSFATILSLFGAAAVNVAFADPASGSGSATDAAKPAVPLPEDQMNAYRADPASPNCYPDINHCASYASGNVTKVNPLQQPQSQLVAPQGKKPQ